MADKTLPVPIISQTEDVESGDYLYTLRIPRRYMLTNPWGRGASLAVWIMRLAAEAIDKEVERGGY